LVIYGGEKTARTPLEASDATWICDFDNKEHNEGRWRAIGGGETVPQGRLAHAQAVHEASSMLYVFGGRSGTEMQENPRNDLWKLDCSGQKGSETWSKVNPKGGTLPEERSFHNMVCIGDSLYVFGGCGVTSGRLNDLHRFDIVRQTWHNLGTSQHLKGRGGATFLPFNSGKLLGVVAGFSGTETNDGHSFEVEAEEWAFNSLELDGLRPRSVCVGGSFPSAGMSILFGGEVDPSSKGHEGAGSFENDLVLLEESTGTYLETIHPNKNTNNGAIPQPRGWSSGAVAETNNGGALFVFGGLSGDDTTPKRLDDLWKLQVEKR
jgi:N-acetylneuraminic acid mutarotase